MARDPVVEDTRCPAGPPAGERPVPLLGDPIRTVGVAFGCRPEDVAENVVVTPFVPLRAFRRHVDEVTAELAPPFFFKGFSARCGTRPVTVVATGVGPSRVGDCLAFLALTPARRVVFAGAVGGLGEQLEIGDYLVPNEVAEAEGFSRYVAEPFAELVRAAPRRRPRGEFAGGVGAYLEAAGLPVRRGAVFTIGCIAFESRRNLELLHSAGFEALEMELSAFVAAAEYYRMEYAVLTYVSDLPLRSSLWQEKSAPQQAALRTAYRALPELALGYATGRSPALPQPAPGEPP